VRRRRYGDESEGEGLYMGERDGRSALYRLTGLVCSQWRRRRW